MRRRDSFRMCGAPCGRNAMQDGLCQWLENVIPGLIEVDQLGNRLYTPLGASAAQEHDDIDRLDDEVARHGDDGFLNELLEAQQRRDGTVGVNGRNAAW